jgi:hypothetical protein
MKNTLCSVLFSRGRQAVTCAGFKKYRAREILAKKIRTSASGRKVRPYKINSEPSVRLVSERKFTASVEHPLSNIKVEHKNVIKAG